MIRKTNESEDDYTSTEQLVKKRYLACTNMHEVD